MRRARPARREAEDAADLDELAVDREDRADDAEIDREEHADGDQRHFRGLEDAEPQDEERHPGDRRDGAQGLQRRIEQAPHRLRRSLRARRARCRRPPRCRSPRARATASPRHGSRVRRCWRGPRGSRRCGSAAARGGPRQGRRGPQPPRARATRIGSRKPRSTRGSMRRRFPARWRSRESGGFLEGGRSATSLVTARSRGAGMSARCGREPAIDQRIDGGLHIVSAGMTPAS